MAVTQYCEKCGKVMDENNFYTYKDGKKTELCKKCLTLHIDNFDPSTFVWILEKMDVPYIESEWNVLRNKAFSRDPYKMNGMSVMGKYLSKMKLKQWKEYGWADTERLKKELLEKQRLIAEQELGEEGLDIETDEELINASINDKDTKLKDRLLAGEISEAEYKTLASMSTQNKELKPQMTDDMVGDENYFNEKNYMSEDELFDPAESLTQDDKIYLAMKWGRLYKPAEWLALEKNYAEYEKSFDLHNADLRRGTLQLCKLDLKSNQALDCGDVDGYAKLARASDSLRKSLKFTEAQRKEDKTAEFSCYGQIVSFAELNNDDPYISPIDLSVSRDIVDKDLLDIKTWIKTLVEDDPTIYKMIEQYIKKRDILNEMEKDQAEAGIDGYQITDKDLSDFREHIEQEQNLDEDIVNENNENEEEDDE